MPFCNELLLFEKFLVMRGSAASTIKGYLRDVRAFFAHTAVQTLPEITLPIVQAWDAHVAAQNQPATRARYRNAVRCFLDYAQTNLGLPKLADEFTPIYVPVHDPKIPTREELLVLLDSLRPELPREFRDAAIITILAMTGVRRSEVQLLNMGDVFVDKDSFQIIATSPKGAGQRRVINFGNLSKPLDIAAAYFGRYYVKRIADTLGGRSHRALNAPLFAPLENPFARLAAKTFNEIVLRAAQRCAAGVRPLSFITPHTLRHFFATYCAVNGMDIRNIQRYMGHANLMTTERYIHLAEKATGVQAREHGPMAGIQAHKDLYLGSAETQRKYFLTQIPQNS